MPQIILGPGQEKLDGSLRKRTMDFLLKLAADDTNPKLHIEPIHHSADSRARTGRVDLSFRAVLFKLQGRQQDASYVFAGTYPHDEAIAIAKTRKLDINPRNGIAELIPVAETGTATPVAPPATPAPTTTPTEPPEAEQSLRARGYTVDDLTALGIDATFAAGALNLAGEDAVLEYAETAPATWQGSALVDLFVGESFDDIRSNYQLNEPGAVDAGDDDAVLTAMQHPAARMQFAFIEDDDELRAAVENPDITAWRIFLHPTQRDYTTRDFSGSFRLTGGAGTGKTVVLLHRARNLHRRNPDARIVLTTFNRTLADALSRQLKTLDRSGVIASDLGKPGIYVAGIDAIAHRILASDFHTDAAAQADAVSRVLGARTSQILKPTRTQAWGIAADTHAGDLPETLRSPSFLDAEYATVVLPNRITTREEYLKVRRAGRGVALNRGRRNAVWNVIESYRASAAAEGSTDFDEKAAVAAEALDGDGAHRPADHVLVDEAQDLSPCRLQLVRALAASGPNDLFLAEDSHQRIYGQKIVLSRYGISIVGRSRRLTLNYRTTQQNLHYALGILTGEQFTDTDDEPESTTFYRSARRGPDPVVLAVDSLTEEYEKVAETVLGWIEAGTAPESIGLLVPTRREGESLPRVLSERGLTVAFVDRDSSGPAKTPVVMTMHRAKGMEFAAVILVGISEKALPRGYFIDSLPEEDRADAWRRERSLLYVAATRARDELVVVYVGKPSELLPASQ